MKQQGLYAIFGFTEQLRKSKFPGATPFHGINLGEVNSLLDQHGVKDPVSNLTYVKIGARTVEPKYDGAPTIETSGGLRPRFSAILIVYCRDGKVVRVSKNMIDGNLDPETVDTNLVPQALHTTEFKTLMPITGAMDELGPRVEVV